MTQQVQTFERDVVRSVRCRYLLHVSDDDQDPAAPRPLMLFLHGAGERGDDLELVTKTTDISQITILSIVPMNDSWTKPLRCSFPILNYRSCLTIVPATPALTIT